MIQTTLRDTNALCWNNANITNTQGCSPAGEIGDTSSPMVDIWPVWCTYRKNKTPTKSWVPHLKRAGQELEKNREENRVVRLKNPLAGTKVLPVKNYSSRAYLWPFGIHVTTDVCHPVHDWYILLSRISISRTQPLPILKNIPMAQEAQRQRQEPTKRGAWYGSLWWCPRLTRTNLKCLREVP